ncbi:serine/threonine-protein kinase [Actinocorallia libanotica]|uniref:serine/threonine-protein kinase n=1 Tax=Actinocorallia libanotica TaxID=46162 RepID=UPI0031E0A70D
MVKDRYRLLSRLGRGGMGSVWLAEDLALGRTVALKELVHQRDPGHRAEFRQRAAREAQALARIRHRAIVQVFDVFTEDEDPWLVMEYVPGRTLGAAIEGGRTIAEAEAARIAFEVAGALQAAHDAGVLHRDVKPHNIILAGNGGVFLVDFGIAHLSGAEPLTARNTMIGTAEFIAPERVIEGRAVPAGDLWSLGITLFTALEGYSPFHRDDGDPVATMMAVVNTPVPEPVRSGRLTGVLRGLLDREPDRRPTPAALRRTLRGILEPADPGRHGREPLDRDPVDHDPTGREPLDREPRVRAPREHDPRARTFVIGGGARENEPPLRARTRKVRETSLQLSVSLAGLPPAEARRLLEGCDDRVRLEVLSLMSAEAAAEIVKSGSVREAAALLALLGPHPDTAAPILRLLPVALAGGSLGRLPLETVVALVRGLAPTESSRLLVRSGFRTAAAVVGALPADHAGRLVETLSLKHAGAVLTYVPPVTVASLLRANADGRTDQILETLPPPVRTQVLRHL